MKRHKFNIFPQASQEDFDRLVSDIKQSGYDQSMPIMLYEGDILDGWNRWLACEQLGITPVTEKFVGTDSEAIEYMMRTNKRRNLTSSQWATIAADANDILEALREAARERQAANALANSPFVSKVETLPPSSEKAKTRDQAAVMFNTNGRYIDMAAQLKESEPELFEEVRAGKLSLPKAKKKAAKKKVTQAKEAAAAKVETAVFTPSFTETKLTVRLGDYWRLGKHTLYCGDTSSAEWLRNKTAVFAFADPPYGADAAEWDSSFFWEHDYLIDHASIVAVTPGIVSIFEFAHKTAMPYRWSIATWITNGMTRGAMGFGNWIYTAIFSNDSIHRNAQDHYKVSIKTSETSRTNHKGRKPAAYMVDLLSVFTKSGDVVIDPFLGSGTTLLACEHYDRACIGGEINPEFCKDIIEQWQNATGKKAVKE